MVKIDKYLFFATFTPDTECGYTITFYDLPGCISEADYMEEGLKNAEEVLGLFLWSMEDDGDEIPAPTKPEDIALEKGEFLVPISVYMPLIREELNNKELKTLIKDLIIAVLKLIFSIMAVIIEIIILVIFIKKLYVILKGVF